MLYAMIDGAKCRATPGGRGFCPGCGSLTIAKCGEVLAEHWAHESSRDCDPWFEGESEWHLRWKRMVSPDQCEVVIGPHRADVVASDGTVIELQHSAISPAEIRERELFYGQMIWIFDAKDFWGNVYLRPRDGFFSFRWMWPRKSHWSVRSRLYWDVGYEDMLFLVGRIHNDVPCGGWGRFVSKSGLLAWANGADR